MYRDLSIFDTVIIGGGFYGSMLSLYFKKNNKKVLLIEKEKELLTKASYNNQARIHNGYHYPRSFITAIRSNINYKKFIKEFKSCIDDTFLMTYAIAAINSKTTSKQFIKVCEQINAPLEIAPKNIKGLFNPNLIEEVFVVEEIVFNAAKIRDILSHKIKKAGIDITYQTEVVSISKNEDGTLALLLKNGEFILCKQAFNCTYASINSILSNSHLPKLPFKYEFTEMPLVQMPDELKNIGLTIMDGPFFSIMPFPDKKMHTIHHVRYTPLESWTDNEKPPQFIPPYPSNYKYIEKDVQRYIPSLKNLKHRGSIYEIKTILLQNEFTDRRPILYKKDYGIKNFHVVMGGKIDNIYDILEEIKKTD